MTGDVLVLALWQADEISSLDLFSSLASRSFSPVRGGLLDSRGDFLEVEKVFY